MKDLTKEEWVKFLQVVEKLGGSAGLKKSIESPKRPTLRSPNDFPNLIGANLNSGSMLFAAYVNINTVDGHTGSGWAWGFGAGVEVTGGVLGYTSWDELTSTENKFEIASVEEGVEASFWIDGSLVAVYLGTGAELDVSLNGGSFSWS